MKQKRGLWGKSSQEAIRREYNVPRPDRHGSREKKIFSAFAGAAKLRIVPGSIEKRNPPEPDILCRMERCGPVAFEMVEVIDQDLGQQTYGQIKMQHLYEEAIQSLPVKARSEVKKRLGNALVHVDYKPKISSRIRVKVIPTVVKLLRNTRPSFQGDVQLGTVSSVGIAIRKITIRRGKFIGRCFSIRAGGSFSDPMIKTVEQKFGKEYPTSNPVELLAYYELQPSPFDWVWQQLDRFTKQNLASSPFRRVWVYSHAIKQIKYIYPPISE